MDPGTNIGFWELTIIMVVIARQLRSEDVLSRICRWRGQL